VAFPLQLLGAWPGEDGGWAWVAAGAVLITIVLFRMQWKRARRIRRERPRETLSEPERQRVRLIEKADQILLTIEEISRETKAVLDNRMRCLELLLEEADRKIKELRSLVSGGAAGMEEHGSRPEDPTHRRVCELYDEGVDIVDIARQTGLPPGEVQLILGLRSTRNDDANQEYS